MDKVDLSKSQWDQTTYVGRAKHFFTVTNPANILLSSKDLEDAKALVEAHRKGEKLPESTTEQDLWDAKYKYDSAYHPDTKEKMFILGRMSAQVPVNMVITGCMMTFYKAAPTVVFWQWINQSFNALVNYTNRSGDTPISTPKLLQSYGMATTMAVGTALFLNKVAAKKLPPLYGRFVPFAAVASANFINIPCMRMSEIENGIAVTNADGEHVGNSKIAAKKAILEVVASRVGMALPGMAIPPLLMNQIANKPFLLKRGWLNAPIQVGIVGLCLLFATPLCCALFPQQSSLSVASVEEEIQKQVAKVNGGLEKVYFNKGL